MKRCLNLFVCIAVLMLLTSTGCRSGGFASPLGQLGGFSQPNAGFNQAGINQIGQQIGQQGGLFQGGLLGGGGILQGQSQQQVQPGFNQDTFGQIGQDLGRRIGNGFLNRAVNQVVNLAF